MTAAAGWRRRPRRSPSGRRSPAKNTDRLTSRTPSATRSTPRGRRWTAGYRVSSTSRCAINSAVYEAGTALQVRAFHVMPGMPPPEGERHSHDYRLEVVVRRDDLDERGMVRGPRSAGPGAARRCRAGRRRGSGNDPACGCRGGDRRGVRPLAARSAVGRAGQAARRHACRPGLGVTARLRRLHGDAGESGRTTVRPGRGRAVADPARGRATSCPRAGRRDLPVGPGAPGDAAPSVPGRDTSGGVRLHPGRQPRTSRSSLSTRRSSSSCTGAASRAGSPSCCLGGGRSAGTRGRCSSSAPTSATSRCRALGPPRAFGMSQWSPTPSPSGSAGPTSPSTA